MTYPSNEPVAQDQLRAFVERIIRMREEAKAINDDIREIYAEAKGNGFDKTVLGKLVAYIEKRGKDRNAVAEADALFDLYLGAYDGIGTAVATHVHAHETGAEPTPQVEVPSGEAAAAVALPAVIPSESNEGQNLSEGGADAEDGVASRPSASGGESAVGGDDMRIAVPAPAIQPGTATRSLDDLAVQDGLKMSSDGKPATGLYSEGMNAGSDKGVTGGESAATPDTRTSIQRTMDEVNAARAKAEDVPTLIRGWTSKQPRPAICLDHSCDSYGPDGFMPCHDCLRVARAA